MYSKSEIENKIDEIILLKKGKKVQSPEDSIKMDLGIDSLEFVQIVHEIEKSFGIKMPDTKLAEAEIVSDLYVITEEILF